MYYEAIDLLPVLCYRLSKHKREEGEGSIFVAPAVTERNYGLYQSRREAEPVLAGVYRVALLPKEIQ